MPGGIAAIKQTAEAIVPLGGPRMQYPERHHLGRIENATALEQGTAAREHRLFVLRLPRHEKYRSKLISGLFTRSAHRKVQHLNQRMPNDVQEGEQRHFAHRSSTVLRWRKDLRKIDSLIVDLVSTIGQKN